MRGGPFAPLTRALFATAAVALLAACSATPAATTGATQVGTATNQPAGTTAGGSTGATPPTAAAPSAAGGGSAAVDLTFTGTKAFTAKGSAGTCRLFKHGDGTVSFGFEATEADYPGIGQSFSMSNMSGAYVDIKWVIDATTSYGDSPKSPVVLSADHHSISVDMDLSPFTPQGGAAAGPEHVKGTVACP